MARMSAPDSVATMSAPTVTTIEVSDGARLTLRTWRTGGSSEIPVLLLHGLAQQGQFWTPVAKYLRAGTIAALDQRGHGASDVPVAFDFSIPRCAQDAAEVCSHLGWDQVILVGHSWGASVAMSAAANYPKTVMAVALIDGGLWGPVDLAGEIGREATLERLRPPALAMAPAELWAMLAAGSMRNWWSPEVKEALTPTFTLGADGLLRSTLGLERHLRVLEGMLDYAPDVDLARIDGPIWAVLCEEVGSGLAQAALTRASSNPNIRLQRWQGAVHDVPLQWPAMVAGLIDTVVETGHQMGREGQRVD